MYTIKKKKLNHIPRLTGLGCTLSLTGLHKSTIHGCVGGKTCARAPSVSVRSNAKLSSTKHASDHSERCDINALVSRR